MVSVDTSKQFLWSAPVFKDKQEETNHLLNRYIHFMQKDVIPPEPTREQELEYLKWLENSIATDKIITLHPKFYGASPNRLRFKNFQEYKKEYYKTFFKNFIFTNILGFPLILYLANKRRYSNYTGVPASFPLGKDIFHPRNRLPLQIFNEYPRRRFFRGLIFYGVVFGLVGSYLVTDSEYYKDRLATRPDLLAMRHMTLDIPLKERKVFDMMSDGSYFGRAFSDQKISIWKKVLHYFYPYHNYDPSPAYYQPFYDYKKDYRRSEFENHYHFKDQ